jgi:arylsulfatase A-like enzyme
MENTIIIITSDHGEAFGERGNFLHYQELYDEILHVPLLVRIPGMAGARKGSLVQSIDIMPTILECLGMNVPDSVDGRSFLGIVTGEQSSVNEFVFAQFRSNYAVRSTKWKFIRRASLSEELYDLGRDPGETQNVVDEQAEFRETYARVLDTFVLRSLSGR